MNYVQRLARAFGPDVDPDETVQDVLLRLVTMSRRAEPVDVSNPAALITTVARFAAIDQLRRGRRRALEVELDDEHLQIASDDEIAALLDRGATDSHVQAAFAASLAEKDFVTYRVVTVWLNMVGELRREPTSRAVAERANTSHTTVNKALQQFRERVAAARAAEDH